MMPPGDSFKDHPRGRRPWRGWRGGEAAPGLKCVSYFREYRFQFPPLLPPAVVDRTPVQGLFFPPVSPSKEKLQDMNS